MKSQMGSVGFVHQQHGVVGVDDVRDLLYMCRHAEIVGGSQQYRFQIRMFCEGFLHLFRRNLSLEAEFFYERRLHVHRHRVCQDQSSHHAAVGIPGNQDFVPGLQGRHQHGMDGAGGAVHRHEAGVAAVQFRRFFLR